MASSGLGVRLRRAREFAEYRQHEIAKVVGVGREVVSYWENDRRLPSFAQLTRLADAYGVTTGSLLGDDPPLMAIDEHELVYRGVRSQPPQTKAAIRRWLTFLDEWADLLHACGFELQGRAKPPKRDWRSERAVTDSRRAPKLAVDARDFYGLGSDAIPDLLAFLDHEGILVYRVELDRIGDGVGIFGSYFNHPRLGACILVNTATTPGRKVFTLAHEFAHALFHYQERGLVSRLNDRNRLERFADEFAAHFLVPGGALRKQVAQSPDGKVASLLDVLDLHRYFRVSYATMLIRLRGEGLLSPDRYEEYRDYSPSRIAARLGLDGDEHSPSDAPSGMALGCYPTSVLDRVCQLVKNDDLSPVAAADLLQVSLEEIMGELLVTPERATDVEWQEFNELPALSTPARRRRGA